MSACITKQTECVSKCIACSLLIGRFRCHGEGTWGRRLPCECPSTHQECNSPSQNTRCANQGDPDTKRQQTKVHSTWLPRYVIAPVPKVNPTQVLQVWSSSRERSRLRASSLSRGRLRSSLLPLPPTPSRRRPLPVRASRRSDPYFHQTRSFWSKQIRSIRIWNTAKTEQ